MESNEGTDFVIGFMGNNDFQTGTAQSVAVVALYIGTTDPRGADVVVDLPNRSPPLPGFPMTLRVEQGNMQTVTFPAGRMGQSDDVRVNDPDSAAQRNNGITVKSTNGADLTVFGVNDESVSTDSFLALPCKRLESPEGLYRSNTYKYFVFSTANIALNTAFSSRFLVVPCEATTITYTVPGQESGVQIALGQYDTFLFQRFEDLTGTIISANAPLSVFVGHECSQVPDTITSCDHMVEQVPPSVTYGQTFFAIPFALRETGDIFKVGSVFDNNEVVVTCSRRTASGDSTQTTTRVTINTGGFHEFRTLDRTDISNLDSINYRREFCCIETSRPATVMQYTLGHSGDMLSDDLGDPAFSLVPPVTQYRNNFLVSTADIRTVFRGFMSWAISAEFFDPLQDASNFLVNGTTFLPASKNQSGSGGYVPIYCKNGEICGYGAFSPISSGQATIQYNSSRDPNAAVYVSVYGFETEISFAYPAGYECQPFGCEYREGGERRKDRKEGEGRRKGREWGRVGEEEEKKGGRGTKWKGGSKEGRSLLSLW